MSRQSIIPRLASNFIPRLTSNFTRNHLSVESPASFYKNKFYDKASGSALFLIFDQISGSCSYTVKALLSPGGLFIFEVFKGT